jgi:Na+/phosphate symporter
VIPYLKPLAGRQVREQGEYYIPDLLSDEEYEADPDLSEAADADTQRLREAQQLIDEAANLVAVLLVSTEQETDARAMQAETILKIVEKKLRKTHIRIDKQETRHRNLFLAYFELKARSEKDRQ